MAMVTIGCRLPNGFCFQGMGENGEDLVLNGQSHAQKGSPIILLTPDICGYTEVPESVWTAIKAKFKDFAPITSGAIFEAKDKKDAAAKHAELKHEKTGLEAIDKSVGKVQEADKK